MKFCERNEENPLGMIPENKDDCIWLLQLAVYEMERLNLLLDRMFKDHAAE